MTLDRFDLQDLIGVLTWGAAYDEYHDMYQEYYATGLQQFLSRYRVRMKTIPLQRRPALLRGFRRIRASSKIARVMGRRFGQAIDRVAGVVAGKRRPPSGEFHPLVGQYHFHFASGRTVRLAVDSSDGGEIASESLLSQSDVYAKTNYRNDLAYDSKVMPLCNGNPLILPYLSLLRGHRVPDARYDLCFIVRVWGGRAEAEGIEHNLRLLEAVNKAKCNKLILAYLVAGDLEEQENRLRRLGIATTRAPLSLRAIWEASASASINIIRLGMHNCVPWRYMDLLAMGSCTVFDQSPQTIWSPAVVDRRHYLHLGVMTKPDQPLASDDRYNDVTSQIESYVADRRLQNEIRVESADYFDHHSCPEALGRQLMEHVLQHREVRK